MKFDACPICGSNHIEKQIISEIFEYKGHKKTIDGCEKFVCEDCNAAFFTDETSKRNEKIIRDFHREIDGLLTSSEIRKIRKALGFTQQAFGNILGGGPKAFAKYESCVLTQSKAMDNLIRMVDAIPENVDFLKNCEVRKTGSFKTVPIVYNNTDRIPKVPKSNYNVVSFKVISRVSSESCEEIDDNSLSVGVS